MSNEKGIFQPTSFTNGRSTMGTASPGREFLKQLLGKTIRVVLKDKLILIGILSCTDRDRNLILSDCATFQKEDEEPISRGDVMVPGEKISKISIPMPLNKVKKEAKKEEDTESKKEEDAESKKEEDTAEKKEENTEEKKEEDTAEKKEEEKNKNEEKHPKDKGSEKMESGEKGWQAEEQQEKVAELHLVKEE